jgi:hypothetical protein
MFYVGQRVVCVQDRLDGQFSFEGWMKNITYFDARVEYPQRGGVYTIAGINEHGEFTLAETPLALSNRLKAQVLSALAGKPIAPEGDDAPAWWPFDLFRPFENFGRDLHWFKLLESVRDIACGCGHTRRHDGKIYELWPGKEAEVYAIAFKQFLGFNWDVGTWDYWNARDIADAVNAVICESDYNRWSLPDDFDWPPSDGDPPGGGDNDRVVQLRPRALISAKPPAPSESGPASAAPGDY